MTIKLVTYRTTAPGPRLTVLGAVHGNERCGAIAINRLVADIDAGKIAIKSGTLQLIPITNPQAYEKNVRFVERNLNRYLYPKEDKQFYEDHLDPILCEALDKTDFLLDLHSYTSKGGPFIFLGANDKKELDFATSLGVQDFAFGWAEAFGKEGGDTKESQGTTEYARTKGAKAVTLECGHHFNEDAPDIGYRAIVRALVHLGMADAGSLPTLGQEKSSSTQRVVKMKSVYRRDEGAQLAKPWKHFDPVAKGEAMATLKDGTALIAPDDGYIVLPKDSAATGEEWFFFGTGTSLPA